MDQREEVFSVQEMLLVFYAGRCSHKGKPCGTLDRLGAEQMVDAGKATWTNEKHKSIKLTRTEGEMPRAATSLLMGATVVERAAEGSRFHQAVAESWRPKRKAA